MLRKKKRGGKKLLDKEMHILLKILEGLPKFIPCPKDIHSKLFLKSSSDLKQKSVEQVAQSPKKVSHKYKSSRE